MPFTYTFPFEFRSYITDLSGDYIIEVDWNNDGDFDDSNEDITSDVKGVRFSRGKDEERGKANLGRLELRLKNDTNKYSPENSGGSLYGNLLPKRLVRVREMGAIDGGATELFFGYIEDIVPHPHWEEKDAHIYAVDGLDHLARHELDTVLWQNITTGTAVVHLLNEADWPGGKRAIDAGQDTIPFAYWHKVKARFALGEVEDSELGFICINGQGNLCWEDRHHRSSAEHQTSQGTIDNTMVALTYDYGAKNIYNEIRTTVTPWEVKGAGTAVLWKLEEIPSIPATATKTWWGNFESFASAIVAPAATTDYLANIQADGGGADKTGDLTVANTDFAKSIKLELTNGAAVPVYITNLQVRGWYYDGLTKVTRKAEDSTSQSVYQKRTLELDGKYMTDADKAQDYCNYAIRRYKDPQPEVTMTLVNSSSALLDFILTKEISDRITVKNDELGMDKDFFVNKMEHEITEGGKIHRATYGLGDLPSADFWSLDYSALGTETKLGY